MAKQAIQCVRESLIELAHRPDSKFLSPESIRKMWRDLLLDQFDPDAQYQLRLFGDERVDNYKPCIEKLGVKGARELYWLNKAKAEEVLFQFWSLAAAY